MIKCIVSACGVVARNAEEKSSHEGNKFISFPLILHLQGKDLTVKELYVTVAAPGDQTTAQEFTTGRKVKLNGVSGLPFAGNADIAGSGVGAFAVQRHTRVPAPAGISHRQLKFLRRSGIKRELHLP